jgi:hypothetical protein
MPALVAGIHAFPAESQSQASNTWMAGTSPAMTTDGVAQHSRAVYVNLPNGNRCLVSAATMGSLVPSLPLSRLRTAFGASWHWSNRPAYQFKIRHQFELGGFDVAAGPGIDLDPIGLYWMRSLELFSRNTGIEYRIVHFEDLDEILPGFPGPSPSMLEKIYGNRVQS